MELKATRMRGSLWAEAPDHLPELLFVLEYAKCAIGEGLQIEVRVAFEAVLRNLSRANVLNDVQAYGT